MSREDLMRKRTQRIVERSRNDPKWRNPPVRVAHEECIVCDSCMRACPRHFGAIFNDGINVVVIPELCSGCNRCVQVCPVDCLYEDPEWQPAPDSLWAYPGTGADPYLDIEEKKT